MLKTYQSYQYDQQKFTHQIKRKISIIYGVSVLLLSLPLWITTEIIASQVAQAYTKRVDLLIDRLQDESYENIIQRAELAARAATQRSFDKDILITEVSVMVSAQNRGAIAPIVQLQVSRSQWKQRPDPKLWMTYFKTARTLLSFDQNTPLVPETTVTTPNNNIPEQAPENRRLRD